MSRIDQKLMQLGITLPDPPSPLAAYVPYVVAERLAFIAGQIPIENGQVKFTGLLGAEVDIATGRAAARLCGLNILAQAKAACGGDLDRVARCVKLGGFVASAPGFTQQPQVVNAASELMQEVFGEIGRHARFAVGTNILPLNAAVEIEAIFQLHE